MLSMVRTTLSAAFATTFLMIALGTQAADPASEARKKLADASGVVKMNEVLCKDVVRFTGEDRVLALGFLHGYFLGKKGATEYVTSTLAKVSDDFMEYCLDHPGEKSLDAFAKFAK